ncbi:small s protein [Zymoseptoria brevis]|uniref:Small s protein n=1 Tax=Zymoseptoria brevis TaxID=1047168 RepID=A0A0F4GYG4_9PEZI|nr:small s protein [Zymoseptoria brevis]
MEAIGLTISILSLAALAQTAVDCFQSVQLGKNFGTDFQTTCIRLDNAQLQLSRWGKALELSRQQHAISSLEASVTAQDVQQAESLLGHIINLFKKAEEASHKFQAKHEHTPVVEVRDVLTTDAMALHDRMRALCLERQKTTSRVQKAKWALYKKRDLDRLVDDIQQLIGDLVVLFPIMSPTQAQLCDHEAAQLRDETALPRLKELAAHQDATLGDALDRLSPITMTASHTWNNLDNTKVVNQVAGNQTVHGGQTISL